MVEGLTTTFRSFTFSGSVERNSLCEHEIIDLISDRSTTNIN